MCYVLCAKCYVLCARCYVLCGMCCAVCYMFCVTTVVSDGLHEPYLLLTNSSFILILSDSHRGCFIWVKFVEIPKQKFESQLNVTYLYFIL